MTNKVARPLFGLSVAFFILVFPAYAARSRYYNLRKGPGLKFRVIGRVKAGEAIKVLKEEAGWAKILTRRGKRGWISQRLFRQGWRQSGRKESSKQIKVALKFQNIPKECAEVMRKSLGELQKRLTPVGDRELELIVSAMPRLRSFRIFLVIDFNPGFYRRVMKRFSQPSTIDLLPFNSCIWALYAYKQALIRIANERARTCAFVRRLSVSLILRRLSGEEVVLETVEDGVYIYFSPVLILKEPDGRSFRVVSEEPEKVGLLSAFALPYPLERGDPVSSRAYEVYRFFRARP